MARPADWSPLTDRDPFPGDPYTVATTGKRYQDTADLIDEQAARLRRLATNATFDSEAGRVFRDHAGKTAESIARAKDRYKDVGGYLTEWSQILDEAQETSLDVLEQARDAEDAMRSSSTSLISDIDDPTDAQLSAEKARQERHDDAAGSLAAARSRLDSLRGEFNGHADRIAGKIRKACDDDVKDGWWDKVKGWIKDNADFLKAFADVMGWIATIAGALALVLAMTGILAPLAALLTVVALVATALSLMANIALAVAGEGSWWAVAFDVVALLTFGVGRIAMSGAKAAYGMTKSAAKVVTIQRTAQAFQNANRFKINVANFASGFLKNSSSPLLKFLGTPVRWLGDRGTQRLAHQFKGQIDDALRPLANLPDPTVMQRISYLDASIAGYATKARELARMFDDSVLVKNFAMLTELRAFTATTAIGAGVATDILGKIQTANNPLDLPGKIATITSPISPWW